MNQQGFINMLLVLLVAVMAGGVTYYIMTKEAKAPGETSEVGQVAVSTTTSVSTICPGDTPTITSLSVSAGPVGTKLEIQGCHFSGFEGDRNAWIENAKGEKGILYGAASSSDQLIQVTLSSPLCQTDTSYSGEACKAQLVLTPGGYKIYVLPWGKVSNKVDFTITKQKGFLL